MLEELADRLYDSLSAYKAASYSPDETRQQPVFTLPQLAELCGRAPTTMSRIIEERAGGLLVDGRVPDDSNPRRRRFTLDQAMHWVHAVGNRAYRRTAAQRGAVISVGFFKGGVGKTTVSAPLAQGLALRGYRVLAIDLDPQGNLTAMLGGDPFAVEIEQTATPLALLPGHEAARSSLVESIRPTYWSGLDLVAANTELAQADFLIPLRSSREAGFHPLRVLSSALQDGITAEYDYVVIDTPPSLGLFTMNAYWAADALLMPIVPDGMSLESSVAFWNLFASLTREISSHGDPKTYKWVGVLPNKVEMHKGRVASLVKIIRAFYGSYALGSQLPLADVAQIAGARFQTLYDLPELKRSVRRYTSVLGAFDQVVTEVDYLTRTSLWGQPETESKEGA